ncbi:MAG: histidine phosphatase family protein [Dehalococcoidia bacterium]|nr:histidine phosphatase family protein [Dehalococcoidia bacterium]
MTRLIMIRHGETNWNVETRKQGRNDQPLNAKGEMQAKLVAEYVKSKYQIKHVWTSPLKRCSDTAQLFNLPVSTSDLLVEIDYGEWEGMLQSEIDRKYPIQDHRNPIWREAPGGEQKSNLPIRGRKWIQESMINDEQGDVVLVGHGGSMKGLLVALLELPDYAMDSFQIDNCSVTTVEIRDGINMLTMLNHTAHLG